MRAIWSGSISFGLISIPIKLYHATEERSISFDMLHKKDLSPIRFARICKAEEVEVPYEDIVKGYEHEGEYVVITDEDFQALSPKNTKSIEILDFCDEKDIDTVYFEKPYFLEPGKGSGKAYVLLRKALLESKKVAIARYVVHNREHIGVLKSFENILILNQLRYKSQIRSVSKLEIPDDVASKKELDMALLLIKESTTKFNANRYKDTYREELEAVIDAKVKGKTKRKKVERAAPSSKVHDIMSLLKASLKKKKASGEAPKKRKAS